VRDWRRSSICHSAGRPPSRYSRTELSAHQISLQNSTIRRTIHPIRRLQPTELGFRQGQARVISEEKEGIDAAHIYSLRRGALLLAAPKKVINDVRPKDPKCAIFQKNKKQKSTACVTRLVDVQAGCPR
jgi:hypothetical protein